MTKNALIAVILIVLTTRIFAQPVVAFDAPASKIRYSTDGTTFLSVPTGNPAQIPGYGTINIALYSAPDGTPLATEGSIPDFDQNGWKIQTSPLIHEIEPIAGAVPAVTVTLDASSGAPDVNVELEAVFWTGSYTTFHQAVAGGTGLVAWSGSASSGGALGWSQQTGDGVISTPIINRGTGAFNGLVAIVPEPSTLILGGLGSVALVIFRRRK